MTDDSVVTRTGPLTRQTMRTPPAHGRRRDRVLRPAHVAIVLIRLAVPSRPDEAGDWLTDGGKRDAVILALTCCRSPASPSSGSSGSFVTASAPGEDRLFATVFLGSGLLFIAMLFCCRRHRRRSRADARRRPVRRGVVIRSPRQLHAAHRLLDADGRGVHHLDDHDRHPTWTRAAMAQRLGLGTGSCCCSRSGSSRGSSCSSRRGCSSSACTSWWSRSAPHPARAFRSIELNGDRAECTSRSGWSTSSRFEVAGVAHPRHRIDRRPDRRGREPATRRASDGVRTGPTRRRPIDPARPGGPDHRRHRADDHDRPHPREHTDARTDRARANVPQLLAGDRTRRRRPMAQATTLRRHGPVNPPRLRTGVVTGRFRPVAVRGTREGEVEPADDRPLVEFFDETAAAEWSRVRGSNPPHDYKARPSRPADVIVCHQIPSEQALRRNDRP